MKVRLASLLLLSVLAWAACKREERQFRVQPSLADRAAATQLSQLTPGPGGMEPPAKNQYEENAYALSEGKHLYSYMNCVGCHAHGGGGMGPALMDDKWLYGYEPEPIFSTIVQGRPNGMPSFRGHLADYQVWELVAYVRSLSGLVNPNAAPNRDDHLRGKKPENSVEPANPQVSTVPQGTQQ
jgi:cytochrome c oxidase cbb3-type subunit 3